MHGLITEEWGDGVYSFRIGWGQWKELDELLQIGPVPLLKRFLYNEWRVADVREVIRVALIGGGATPVQAIKLVKLYVEDRPISENVGLASRILSGAMFVPEGSSLGKAEATPKVETDSISKSPLETLQ